MANEGIEVDVYRWTDPSTKVKTLHGRKSPSFVRQYNAQGAGSIIIPVTDPEYMADPTLLDYRNILKFRIDGDAEYAIIIRGKDFTTIGAGEKAEEAIQISGPGLRGWLDNAILYPSTALNSATPDKRSFNWAGEQGPWYDPAAWINPFIIANYGPSAWNGRPNKWPDPSGGRWIWGENKPYPQSAPENSFTLFRYEYPVAIAGTYRIYFVGDDWVDMWIDGSQVVTTDKKGSAFDTPNKQDAYFDIGTHIISFKVTNRPGLSGNPAALLMALYLVDSNNNEIFKGRSSSDGTYWKAQFNPASVPGWTTGSLIQALFDEAVARGVQGIDNYTLDFTDTHDSNGELFPYIDWQFDIGTKYSDIMAKIEEQGGTFVVDPETYTAHYYLSYGQERTAIQTDGTGAVTQVPVILQKGKNLLKASGKGVGHLTNSAIIKTAEGWTERIDSAAVATNGRIEETIDASSLPAAGAYEVAGRYFDQKAQPEEGATYDLIPLEGAWPFKDFNEGDWVLAPDMLGQLVPRRVMSISVTESDDIGKPVYTIEFDTIFQDTEERLSAQMKKLGGGGSGSMASTSLGNNPVNPPIVIGGTGSAPTPQPMVPQDVEVTSVGKWQPNGITPYSEVSLTWAPVTQNTDLSDTIPQFYEVQAWSTTIGPASAQIYATVTDNAATITLPVNQEWNFQVRAVNDDGQRSDWSSTATHTTLGPITPMDPPTTPTLSSSLGLLSVVWDGKIKPASPIDPPPQFRYTYIEVAPHGSSTWQQMGSVFQRGGGTANISNLIVGDQYDVRLIAIDGAGIASDASGIATITITGVDLGDLDSSVQDAIDAADQAAQQAASLNGLILDASFEDTPFKYWTILDAKATQVLSNVRTGTHAMKFTTGATSYSGLRYNNPVQIDVGDSFLMRGWARCGAAGAVIEQGLELGLLMGPDPDISTMTTVISVATNDIDLDVTYTKITGSVTIPAGNYRWAVPVVIINDTVSGHVYYLDDVAMFQMTDSSLIVDGSITADAIAAEAIVAGKLAAGSVAAANIQAQSITAEKMAAGSVTADAIAASSITGDKIVAGTIEASQLSPSVGNDIDISANDTVTIIAGQAQAAQDSADANADNLSIMQTYYAFGSDGAVISKPGSPFSVALRSDRIEMLENGNVVSYWTSGQFYVNDMVGEKVILGNHQLEKYGNGTVVRAL
jgi:hypothetical protein